MHAAILYLLEGEPKTGELESDLSHSLPAFDVDGTNYLDGQTLYHGEAAGRVHEETRIPVPTEKAILEEKKEITRTVGTDFYVDLEGGWAGISTSDGEFVFDWLRAREGVTANETLIRLDDWADELVQREKASVWAVSYSQSEDEGDDSDRAGSQYHDDVESDSMPATGKSALGFSYRWRGDYVRGMIAASGYVAAYNISLEEVFAKWVADEVLPFVERDLGDDEQFLKEIQDKRTDTDETDSEDGEVLACENCPRESESVQETRVEAGEYINLCVACRDYFYENGEVPEKEGVSS